MPGALVEPFQEKLTQNKSELVPDSRGYAGEWSPPPPPPGEAGGAADGGGLGCPVSPRVMRTSASGHDLGPSKPPVKGLQPQGGPGVGGLPHRPVRPLVCPSRPDPGVGLLACS